MIVAFADRRRPSDVSTSNVVRKSKGKRGDDPPGQMIVPFARRKSSGGSSRSNSTAHPKGAGRSTLPSSSAAAPRRIQGGPSKKKTSPAPADPEGKRADAKSDRKARPSTKEARRRPSSRRTHEEVIVDFPKRNRSHRRHNSLGGSLRKNGEHENVGPKSQSRRTSRASPKDPARNSRGAKGVDWRNSSLDWGGDGDQSTSDQGQDRARLSHSFQDSVDWRNSSVVWGDSVEAAADPRDCSVHCSVRSSCRNTELTDSTTSMPLDFSFRSLLSISER